jgi:acetoin utilization deacetylase AcuC-like enzyme
MRAFFHPDQHLHKPQQVFRLGRLIAPNDVPARVEAFLDALRDRGITPEQPRDCGEAPTLAVHTAPYVTFLKSAYERWRAIPNAGAEILPNTFPYWSGRPEWEARPPCPATAVPAEAGYYLGDLSVPMGEGTWRAALAASHTAVAAADAVLDGAPAAYALCRPPGHHARADRASGFCYLNNAAIAAQRLRSRHARVAVLDVDTHHGDGTQQIFYGRGDVLTVSLHGDPAGYYPFFTGYAHERGVGAGAGANINIVLPPGAGVAEFLTALDRGVAAVRDFGAGALVVPLGFDTHERDPIGVLKITTEAFHAIGARIGALALPTVVVQEGGYAVPVLGACLSQFIEGFAAAQ